MSRPSWVFESVTRRCSGCYDACPSHRPTADPRSRHVEGLVCESRETTCPRIGRSIPDLSRGVARPGHRSGERPLPPRRQPMAMPRFDMPACPPSRIPVNPKGAVSYDLKPQHPTEPENETKRPLVERVQSMHR